VIFLDYFCVVVVDVGGEKYFSLVVTPVAALATVMTG